MEEFFKQEQEEEWGVPFWHPGPSLPLVCDEEKPEDFIANGHEGNKQTKKDTCWTRVLPVLINITLLTQCVFLYDCGITYSKPWHIKGKNDPT